MAGALGRALRLRAGESRTVARLLGFTVVVWSGTAIGANAAESLFFARFGARNLPFMYLALGPVTFAATVGVTALLARAGRRGVLVAAPLVLAAVAAGLRGLVLIDAGWVYPPLWLSMMVIWVVLGVVTWGLAGLVHDTRQAKRLFPLYGAGVILGGAVGGLVTSPLASWLGAENLLLVWSVALAAGVPLARAVAGATARHRHAPLSGPRPRPVPLHRSIGEGFSFVRRSALLRWMSLGMVLLALLYFSLSLPFARAVTDRFPDPDRLAGFLGLLVGATNLAALALSLLAANRLFARLGVPTAVLVFPVIYLAGFAGLAVSAGFTALVGFRFVQLAWYYGVWSPGWQALWGVVPPERRDQTRAFMDGGPMQVGIMLSGVLLLLTQDTLSPRAYFAVAAAVAALAVAAGWQVRQAYRRALVDALRAGWPDAFVVDAERFGGLLRDRAARAALEGGARDPDPALRRVAVELASRLPGAEGAGLLALGLEDPDAQVRAGALRALANGDAPVPLATVAPLLGDADPTVRAAAVDVASRRDGDPAASFPGLRALLSDPDLGVRLRAAAALSGRDASARALLAEAAASPRPEDREGAVAVLGEMGTGAEVVLGAAADPEASVRRAAATALPSFGRPIAAPALLDALGDPDLAVREAAADALVTLGEVVWPDVAAALEDGRREEAALAALVRLPVVDARPLQAYARRQRDLALRYHGLWLGVAGHRLDGQAKPAIEGRLALLAASLRVAALSHAERSLHAMAPFGDHEAVDVALENLASRDPDQRANALEALEAASDPDLTRRLLPLWEGDPASRPDGPGVVLAAMGDDDPWIRACAAHVAGALEEPAVRKAVRRLAETDADPLVREAAAGGRKGVGGMEGLDTLSLMDRVVALRGVPLFRELAPADLAAVAGTATEHAFGDGTVIARQGDPGDAMHVVVTGEVRVLVEGDGHQISEVARRRPGYFVGEMAILSHEPRMASIVAAGDVRTLSIDRKRFQRILRERPDASLAVMRELCLRLREAHAGPAGEPRH